MLSRIAAGLGSALAVSAAGLVIATSPAAAAVTCTKFAAPSGSDSAAGTSAQPFATPQKLVSSLQSGQTGCLKQGTYHGTRAGGDPFEQVKFSTANVSLASYPGERAKIIGRLYVAPGANGVNVENLDLDGKKDAVNGGIVINADDVVFRNNDVFNENTDICFIVGSSYGRAHRTVIEGNRIHDCGIMPAENHDHGIYVAAADDTVIKDNMIYDNADRGIQLYPDAQGSKITGNVIDGNGEGIIFSGDHGTASHNNLVEGNIITNSKIRHNVESFWPDGNPVGTGNVVRGNCIKGANGWYAEADGSGVENNPQGFSAKDNLVADPMYVDRAAKNFQLKAGSPCGGGVDGILSTVSSQGGSGGSGGSTTASPPPTPAPTSSVTAPVRTTTTSNSTSSGGETTKGLAKCKKTTRKAAKPKKKKSCSKSRRA